jgi:acyl-CoA synthetase (AMP-forming)/AMP-acid ligase II
VQVKIADAAGAELPAGSLGEIWAKGSNVAEEYLFDPELTREKFSDGWFRTGDLARVDADGYLELLGRTDDMINVGGKKLYPLEIEQRLKDAFPEIDCAVAGEANEHLGTRLVLCYSEATPVSPALLRDMAAMLAKEVEAYKVPSRAVAVPAIPRTANGKVVRQDLGRLLNGETK